MYVQFTGGGGGNGHGGGGGWQLGRESATGLLLAINATFMRPWTDQY
jgi:hypothetical protein